MFPPFSLVVVIMVTLLETPAPSSETAPWPVTPPIAAGNPREPVPGDSIRTDLNDYIWPTDAGHVVTSTFGEYRRTHFHAGIDVSTGDNSGYRVFASRAGYISRIRVIPVGYGKMLYVRHQDGYTTTYAHLSRFAPRLESRAQEEELRLSRYPVDIECAPNEFPVGQGDLIGYTGSTGTGSAHLHFEIRDEKLNGVNPSLGKNFKVPDDNPPIIRKIAITPLDEYSTVDGLWSPSIIRARQDARNNYRIARPIIICGQAGMAVDVRDRFRGSRFLEGAYSHQLSIDDNAVYSVKLDRVPVDDAQQIGLYHDSELLEEGRGNFEKMYMDSPNDLQFYEPKIPHAGIINSSLLREGSHRFTITSRDIQGNSAAVSGVFIVSQPPSFSLTSTEDGLKITAPDPKSIRILHLGTKLNHASGWSTSSISPHPGPEPDTFILTLPPGRYDVVRIIAENEYGVPSAPRFHFIHKPAPSKNSLSIAHEFEKGFVRILLSASGDITSSPDVVVYEGTQRRSVHMIALDLNKYAGAFKPIESFTGMRRVVSETEVNGALLQARDEFSLFPIESGKAGTISFDRGACTIDFDSASVFETEFVRISKTGGDDGPAFLLSPDNAVLRGGITVTLGSDSLSDKTGFYFRRRGHWGFLPSRRSAGGTSLSAELHRTLGEVALLDDNTPPKITGLSIGSLQGGRPTVSFRFSDNRSGVDYNEVKMYIDKRIVIPEIDGEHRKTLYRSNDPLTRGSHLLTIHISDNQGNTSTVERHFVIR